MAKVGNEAKLILSLAEAKIEVTLTQLRSSPSCKESHPTMEARKQGRITGLTEAQKAYRGVIMNLERGR